jgi:hypothetical protein
MSSGIGLARWGSLGGGGYPAVDGDRREAMQLEEGKKGLGWPQIGEENSLGRGSLARGERWHLWRFPMKGVDLRILGMDEKQGEEWRSVTRVRFGEKVARFKKCSEGGSGGIFVAGERGKRRGHRSRAVAPHGVEGWWRARPTTAGGGRPAPARKRRARAARCQHAV